MCVCWGRCLFLFLMARERKDVSSLDSGVPLLLMKTKQKREEDKGRRVGTREGDERREGQRKGAKKRERESKKSQGASDNNAVCSMTET